MLGCTKAVSNLQKEIQGTTNKTTKTIAMKISKATTTNTATTHSDYNKNTTCPYKDIDITYIQHHNKDIDITYIQHHNKDIDITHCKIITRILTSPRATS